MRGSEGVTVEVPRVLLGGAWRRRWVRASWLPFLKPCCLTVCSVVAARSVAAVGAAQARTTRQFQTDQGQRLKSEKYVRVHATTRQTEWLSVPTAVPSQCCSSAARANQEYTVQDSVLGPTTYLPLHFTGFLNTTEVCPEAPSETLGEYCKFAVQAQSSDVLVFHLGEHFKSAEAVKTELGSLAELAAENWLGASWPLQANFLVPRRLHAALPELARHRILRGLAQGRQAGRRRPVLGNGRGTQLLRQGHKRCDCGPIERPTTPFQNDALVSGFGESSTGRRLHWQIYTAGRWDMRPPPGFSRCAGDATAHDREIVSRKTADCTHFFPSTRATIWNAPAALTNFQRLRPSPGASVWMPGALLYQPVFVLDWASKAPTRVTFALH